MREIRCNFFHPKRAIRIRFQFLKLAHVFKLTHDARLAGVLNRNGFSLVEILIAVGLLSITSLVIATLFTQMSNMVSIIDTRSNATDLMNQIRFALGPESACNSTLNVPNFQSLTIPTNQGQLNTFSLRVNRLRISVGTPLLLAETNQSVTPRLTVSQINFRKWQRVGTSSVYMASLEISFSPPGGATGIPLLRSIPVNFEAPGGGATGQLTRCSTLPLTPTPPTGPLANWPHNVFCGGNVWTIVAPGVYHCFRGGELTTRSSIMKWDSGSRRMVNSVIRSDEGYCGVGSCDSRTMDEILATGEAW